MLVFSTCLDFFNEEHDADRKRLMDEIKSKTGESCLLLPLGIEFVGSVPVKADNAAPAGEAAPSD